MSTLICETAMRKRFNRLGWALVIMVAAVDVCFILMDVIWGILWQIGSETLDLTVGTIFETLLYVGGFLLAARLYFPLSHKVGNEPVSFAPKLPKYLPLLILAGIGICHSVALVSDMFCDLIGYSLPYDETVAYMSDPEIFALYMTLSLAPAFAEELLFRGVVYSNLRPFGKSGAVIISSLLFALMHQNVEQLLYTFAVGVVAALIYEWSGSIWGSIMLHMFVNLYATLQTAISYRMNPVTAGVILTLFHAAVMLAAAISILLLLYLSKKNSDAQRKDLASSSGGTFGQHSQSKYEAYQAPASEGMWLRCLCKAPGMVTYLALTLFNTVLAILSYT